MCFSRFLVYTAAFFVAGAVSADSLVPNGSEFLVNSNTTDNQGFPDVATDGQGTFLVTWESNSQDSSGFGIFGQLMGSDGQSIGDEFQVNDFFTDNQFDPRAAFAPGGGFVVVWASYGQDGADFGVFARRFDASGMPLGKDIAVNTTTMGEQNYPDVAIADDGSFLVVWEGQGLDSSFGGINAQRFDSQGTAIGDEFLANTTTTEQQNGARISRAGDGFVVVWESIGIDTDGEAVMIQVFAADGTPLGGEITLNETTSGDQEDPIVTGLGTDGFLATWYGPDGMLGLEVWGRYFDLTGFPVGPEFRVNTESADDQDRVSVAGGADGRAIAAWRSFGGHDGDRAGVFAQGFEVAMFADGFESGNTQAWSQTSP